MSVPALLAVVVLVCAMPLNWYVTVTLWRLSRQSPGIRVIRERTVISLSLSVIVTIFGLVFLNNDMATPVVSGETTKLITRAAVVTWSLIPASYFLWIYRRH